MNETDLVPTTTVPGLDVGNDQVANIKPKIRHNFYYFHNLVFKVEDTLFCVPRNAFEVPNGNFFSETLFSVPGPGANGEQTDGRDDQNPIVLEGIAKEHFIGFLRVMYPFDGADKTTKYEDWVGVLHLATKWEFSEIRAKSIQVLSGFLEGKPVIDKILLAKKYHIKEWLFAGYTSLVLQDQLDLDPLLSTLDTLTVARLFFIREAVLKSRLLVFTTSEPTPDVAIAWDPEEAQPQPDAPSPHEHRIETRCVSRKCGRTVICYVEHTFQPLEETEVRSHVVREFASEIVTW